MQTIFQRQLCLAVCIGLGFMPVTLSGQSSPTPLPANYIVVDAPMAERLTLATKAAHPEITKLGLHATPPSAGDNAIIGSDTPGKIGKKSSSKDMKKLATGQPSVDRLEKEGIYDLLLPLTDRNGADLGQGFVVMEVPFKNAANEAEALKIGVLIRDEMQTLIPDRGSLYRQ